MPGRVRVGLRLFLGRSTDPLALGRAVTVERDLLTVDEAARELGVKPSTVRLLLMRDQLSAVRVGAFEIRIPVAELEALRRRRPRSPRARRAR